MAKETKTIKSDKEIFLVGMGASAGGLEALRLLVSHLEPLKKTSLVVVQHLSPEHRSMLVDLIARETSILVKEAQNGAAIEPNCIYITPPNANIFIKKGKVVLKSPMQKSGPKPSVDLFLESIASEYGERSVGVILSGTGSDGARGIRAIKTAGGFTLAQSPNSAKYDGMPKASIDSGLVDFKGLPEEIATKINSLDHDEVNWKELDEIVSGDPYHRVMLKLRDATGVDFLQYKSNTIRRRLQRRMLANKVSTLEKYLIKLDENESELESLFQDILISVTSFFRDPEAYESLGIEIQKYIESTNFQEDTFRVWVPGCATGEEAYSLAMLITEKLSMKTPEIKVQIFATDISEPALNIARKGIYPSSALENLPARFKEKYMTPSGDEYKVKKSIRDKVAFAKQNIISDPPFLRIDLVSCRNLFIYFNQETQEKIFSLFHFSLNTKGILFLGKSESLGKKEKLFSALDQSSRIFVKRRVKVTSNTLSNFDTQTKKLNENKQIQSFEKIDVISSAISKLNLDVAIIDEALNYKKVFGKMNEIMKIPIGDASQSFVKCIHPDLRSEFSTLIHKCRKANGRVLGRYRNIIIDGKLKGVQISVVPNFESELREYLVELLCCDNIRTKNPKKIRKKINPDPDERIKELEEELLATREHLQTVVEELETSNEELQSLNEELQSSNEELQSANEELETSNEELHATNEELTTLNEEINIKSAESSLLNEYLENIQRTIKFPLIVIDQNFRVVRHNPACAIFFRATGEYIGQNLRLIPTVFDLSKIHNLVEQCLKTADIRQKTIKIADYIFEVYVQPLKKDEKVQGACVALIDVTDRENALKASKEMEAMLQSILRNTPALVSLKNPSGVYTFVNDQFCKVMQKQKEEVLGKTDDEIFSEEISSLIQEKDFEALRLKRSISFSENINYQGKKLVLFSAKVPLLDSKDSTRSICTISLDITEKTKAEEIIRNQQEQLIHAGKLSALGEMAAGIAHEINTPLNAILANSELVQVLVNGENVDKNELNNSVQEIGKLVKSISDIITGLRTIARADKNVGFEKKNLEKLIGETLVISSYYVRNHGVKVETEFPEDAIEIECQPVQLSQVLINLINNAVDAIKNNDEKWIKIIVSDEGERAEISVIDSGNGIDKELADKIMTPFYTTKKAGEGTGMGLSLSKSIINIHGGELYVDTNCKNTCFKIILPKVQTGGK